MSKEIATVAVATKNSMVKKSVVLTNVYIFLVYFIRMVVCFRGFLEVCFKMTLVVVIVASLIANEEWNLF